MKAIDFLKFKEAAEQNLTVLDLRSAEEFKRAFIPGSVFMGMEGRYTEWARNLFSLSEKLMLVGNPGSEDDAIIQLEAIGFKDILGYLKGGFGVWEQMGAGKDMVIEIDVDELAMDLPFDPNMVVVDVRTQHEFAEGHIQNAVHLNLAGMRDLALIAQFEETQNLYVHSGSGYRSLIACSLLKRQGYHNLRHVSSGWEQIKKYPGITIEKEASVLN